ncbi:sensor histidine kinase [Streptomyces sp. DSM 44917]|uniref:histidine kinase n=1 Tax=Streptomyces boetiae TaxID=3075541 RepID=A0ABU2LAY6_9ACTN|nr:sensor histidine kinase [Streptomyces sp. DSM 44917]MDT0308378.1 sensor histidine kinase [Streptomyces sp. DSM 44917]
MSLSRRVWDLVLPPLVGLYLCAVVLDGTEGDGAAPALAGVAAAVVQGAALRWRRARPVAVFGVTLVGGAVIHLVAPEGVFPYAGLFAIGALAALRPPRVSLPALAALLALTALNYLTGPAVDAHFAMTVPVIAWALGDAARSRRNAVEQAARRAIAEERDRIQRELHDVIAHSVSVMVVQAAAAGDVFDQRPDQARESLAAIETAGRETLGELRRLLASGEGERHPQPGLDRLPELVTPLRTAGLEVTLSTDVPGPLPAGVELSAFRIAQEALTNALRHAAGATRVEVRVCATEAAVEIEVRDNGRPGAPARAGRTTGSGAGLAGMRERAAMLGGTLAAGPTGDGFRVRAVLPLNDRAEAGR